MKKGMALRFIAAVLAVVVLLCPLSVCLAAEEVIVNLVFDELITTIWNSLAGWGIKIVESGYQEITENVRYWLNGQIIEYLEDEVGETIDSWITGMQFYRDQFGRLIGNSEYVEAADQFANHLRQAFGLANNGTIVIQAAADTLGDLVVYQLPLVIADTPTGSQTDTNTYTVYTSDGDPVYGVFHDYNTNNVELCFFSLGDARIQRYRVISTGQTTTSYYDLSKPSGYNYYFIKNTHTTPKTWMNDHGMPYYSWNLIDSLLKSNVEVEGSDISIVAQTGTINTPSDDSGYQSGYSMIFYPDGTIAYLDINWPETISVDNLPAIVSTGNIRSLDLNGAFAPLRGFISTFEDGFGLMTQLIYNLPTPAVSMALAIMSAMIVFGTIKIFKEH